MTGSNNNKLVPGEVRNIALGKQTQPVYLQVIHLKAFEMEAKEPGAGASFRYKIVLSDSMHFIQGTLAGPLNHLFESKMIETCSIVRLTQYHVNDMKGHKILYVSGIDVGEIEKFPQKIGIPGSVEASLNAEAASSSHNVASATPTFSNPTLSSGSSVGGLVGIVKNELPPTTTTTTTTTTTATTGMTPNKRSFEAVAGSEGLSKAEISELTPLIQPINTLSPYNDRWVIKARVVGKTEVKKWANAKGDGKLFSATLVDASGEIRMTAFKDACDKFFDVVQNGRVYLISNALVKIAKKQFGGVKNDYEIHLETNSLVQETGEEASVPASHYAFTPISKLGQLETGGFVDVLGVLRDVGPVQSITAKSTQRQLSKRDVTLLDTYSASVRLTLWGEQAEHFGASVGQVVAVKSGKISEYNGSRSLSTSLLEVSPKIPQAQALFEWYQSEGINYASTPNTVTFNTSISERKSLEAIKLEGLGKGEKADYLNVIATIAYVRTDGAVFYTACPSEGCNKKVTEYGPNLWRCERCARQYDTCHYRYLFSPQISDATDSHWVNLFNEAAEAILGISAEALAMERLENETAYQDRLKALTLREFLFKLRVKLETYQGESKVRVSVLSASPVDYLAEAKQHLEEAKQLL